MNLAHARIALIGGAGLVGSHIVDALLHEPVDEIVVFDNFIRGSRANLANAVADPRVRIVDGTMTDRRAVDEVLAGMDGVFLLASLWLGECLNDPRSAWDVCTMGTWNVVEACLKHNIKRIVYSSSASVYGDALMTPMTEDHPFNNRTTYGATKIACEQMLRAMYAQHRLPAIYFRYMNIYGPRMDHRGVYVSVIMKVLDRIAAGLRPRVFGDGSQIYDFVYIEDVARANVLGMKADCADEAFNIGCGVGTSIAELVALLLELTGSSLEPEYIPEERSLVTRRIGSTDKAERLLGFRATTSLRDGLHQLIEWRQRNVHAAAPVSS
ncbi:MAG TPA: NAD-dependent epimerase/dehydratase family protein [Vicinamibacterales bacterium]|nr:NAD-dependent epimerase/dehydratase family protein [Vicinamibacterales bacterium]